MLGGPLTHSNTHSGDARHGGAHAVDMTAMASSSIHTPAATASSLLATLRFKRTAMEQHWDTAAVQQRGLASRVPTRRDAAAAGEDNDG